MDNQQRVNRRLRRNLPAELKVEIVDCFPVENAVHFLANVPNRLIIHHCAPRIRRILKMIGYARTLPAANSNGNICLKNGHKYTPALDFFLRYGAAHCGGFVIWHGLTGYPADFFNDLIKFYYETKEPKKAVRDLVIELSWANPAPWPAALVQPEAGEMNVEEKEVNQKWVIYILRNKQNPRIAFKLFIHFNGSDKCYQQMTLFEMWRFW